MILAMAVGLLKALVAHVQDASGCTFLRHLGSCSQSYKNSIDGQWYCETFNNRFKCRCGLSRGNVAPFLLVQCLEACSSKERGFGAV